MSKYLDKTSIGGSVERSYDRYGASGNSDEGVFSSGGNETRSKNITVNMFIKVNREPSA